MEKETNDIVVKILTELTEYEVRMKEDVNCVDFIHTISNLLELMTFTRGTIVRSLREVADEMEDGKKNENNGEYFIDI